MGLLYRTALRPFLFRSDPEEAHERAIHWLRQLSDRPRFCRAVAAWFSAAYPDPVELWGLCFPNPVGLAAGMDKDGACAPAMEALGFGFLEVGTVTPEGQPGNPRPRLFRFPKEGALINRMGFNNAGATAMSARLTATFSREKRRIPLGINIGKAKATPLEEALKDYQTCMSRLVTVADYFVINVSSPNTPELRRLQGPDFLRALCRGLMERGRELAGQQGRRPWPLLLKIAPDNSFAEIDAMLEILLEAGFAGIVATNTTVARQGALSHVQEAGGLSGRPLEDRATAVVRHVHRVTEGKLPIIGVGGIHNVESARAKLDAGASLIQVYTAFVYEGPGFPGALVRGLRRANARA